MPNNDDNIVKFKPKTGKKDEKAQAKKELMDRIVAGSRNLRRKVRNEHIVYYSVLLVFVAMLAIILIYQAA